MIVAMRAWPACVLAILVGAACDVRVSDEGGVSVGLSSGRAEDEWVRTYTLAEAGRLEIANVNGAIEVAGAPGSEVEVHVYREARAGDDEAARQALQTLEIVEESAADAVSVTVRRVEGERGRGRRERVTARIHVRVPAGITSAFRTQSGPIRLEYVSGTMTAAVTNGSISGSGIAGGVQASVANGSIALDMLSVTAPTELTVVNGSIQLELPDDIRADLEASALNGRISVDEAFALEADRSGDAGPQRRVAGSLNGGGPPITLQATNGAVRIESRGGTRPDAGSRR